MSWGDWTLSDWRVVAWSTDRDVASVVAQIEQQLLAAESPTETTEGEADSPTRLVRDTTDAPRYVYRDRTDTTVVQLHPAWEDDERWSLHALQFSRPPQSDNVIFRLDPLLEPLPDHPPTPQALPLIRLLAAGTFPPRVWSVIVDAPSAAVESWLRTTIFPQRHSSGHGADEYAYGGPFPYVVAIDDTDYWVWYVLAPPRWVSVPSGNFWVVPTVAAVTRPAIAPIAHVSGPAQSGLAVRIAEYHGRTMLDCYTSLPVHPLLDRLDRLFREGEAQVLFPVLAEYDKRAEETWLLRWFLRSPQDESVAYRSVPAYWPRWAQTLVELYPRYLAGELTIEGVARLIRQQYPEFTGDGAYLLKWRYSQARKDPALVERLLPMKHPDRATAIRRARG